MPSENLNAPLRRYGLEGRAAAVASPHLAATEVGERVLREGGNAIDAGIAVNAMLAVVYPHMCGLGGDSFLLYYEARSGKVHCLNGTGPAPALATPAAFAERRLEAVPARGPLALTVPGAVAAWGVARERFGSWPLARLLAPAIAAAADGVPIGARLAGWIDATAPELAQDRTLRRRFLDAEGGSLPAGATLRQPELAATLERLALRGTRDLYCGELAGDIDRACTDAGGLLRLGDLERYEPDWVDPISLRYRGLDVYVPPPNSQGIAALLMLRRLAARGSERLTPGSAAHVRALVDSKRAAFAVRDRYVTDPDHMDARPADLLNKRLDPEDYTPALADPVAGDTVYICILDGDGNAVSLIQSIYYAFGSCFVAGDTGILMQNRGHYFSLDPTHPNVLQPGKRTLHTLMASIALESGTPRLVFGAMGADGQPQTNVQVLERYLAGADAQQAVTAPRTLHGRFLLEDELNVLHIEDDLGEDVIRDFNPNAVLVVPPLSERMGHAHAIAIAPDGEVSAGADPRSDGTAAVIHLNGSQGPGSLR